MVRGVILDLAPGQESTSLLVSPEGWLIGLTEIKDAEDGQLPERPWCFTNYGISGSVCWLRRCLCSHAKVIASEEEAGSQAREIVRAVGAFSKGHSIFLSGESDRSMISEQELDFFDIEAMEGWIAGNVHRC